MTVREGTVGTRRCAALAAAVVAVLLAVAAFGRVERDLIRLTPDDAYYYLEIARRLWLGQGSTFDGVQPTNGYHPLWCAMLVPLGPLFEASRDLGARAAAALSIAWMALALALTAALGRRTAPQAPWVALLVATCTLAPASIYGLETALALALLAAAFLAVDALPRATAAGGAAAGALLGAVVLARIDLGLHVAVIDAMWLVAAARGRAAARPLALAVAAQAALVGAYLTFDLLWFGEALPISASIKVGRGGGPNLRWAKSLLALLGIGSGALGVAVLALRLDRTPTLRAVALATAGHAALLATRGASETYNWTFAPTVLGGAVLLGAVVPWLGARVGRTTVRAAVVVGCLGLLAVAVRGKLRPTGFAEKLERALWIRDHVPPGATFAEGDCGLLGYLSEHAFVNVDGLTGSVAFQQAIRDDTLLPWFEASGVDAVVLPAEFAGATVPLRVRPGRSGHRRHVDAVLAPYEPPVADARYRLWRIVGFREADPAVVSSGAR
ncbi:MAG: hypothetical protein R3F59_00085 [Myxococcota bacterium]